MIHSMWIKHNGEVENCTKCPRLVAWREEISKRKRRAFFESDYWGKPVPGFGDVNAKVIVVGLAPGAHGSNRTGRMFTGDSAGNFLYRALYKAGFCNQPESTARDDGLILTDLFITALCRCVPPDNRPTQEEILNCQMYLQQELFLVKNYIGIVCLGRLAFDTIKKLVFHGDKTPINTYIFRHNAYYNCGNGLPWIVASYHPSQQNTQTGRLTEDMFNQVWADVRCRLTKENDNGVRSLQ